MIIKKKLTALDKARSALKKADRATTPLAIKKKLKIKQRRKT